MWLWLAAGKPVVSDNPIGLPAPTRSMARARDGLHPDRARGPNILQSAGIKVDVG